MGMGCLLFYTQQKLSWVDSARFCQEQDSEMLQIHSQEEMNFIASECGLLGSILGDLEFWTGGTDAFEEGSYV